MQHCKVAFVRHCSTAHFKVAFVRHDSMSCVQVGMPEFELVDLPGLQAFPEERYQATSQLIDHYLQQPDTLILCVIDATTPALDSSLALKMLISWAVQSLL